MQQIARLVRYLRPYWPRLGAGVLCMGLVGALEAFRILLIGPIFDRVLNPAGHGLAGTAFAPNVDNPNDIKLFSYSWSGHTLHLSDLLPSRIHDPWMQVAVALVGATLLKGIFDYIGTYF